MSKRSNIKSDTWEGSMLQEGHTSCTGDGDDCDRGQAGLGL